MSSFNFIGDIYSGENPYLLNNVLRGEWGFQGMAESDWNGSYGYQQTDACVRNGNDIMLGFMQHESNQMDNLDSPTLVNAMRQACKNIMYTVVNSGAYAEGNLQTGMDPMTRMFVTINVIVAACFILIENIPRCY
jgi:beta-glucosidase